MRTDDTDASTTKPSKRHQRAAMIAEAASGGLKAILIKIALLGIVDAIALYGLFILFLQQQWLIFGLVAAVTLVVNWIYFTPGKLPAKYLTPGVIFLVVFQIFVVG